MFLLEDFLSVRNLPRHFLQQLLLHPMQQLRNAWAGVAVGLFMALSVQAQTQVLNARPAGQVVKTPPVQAT